MAGLYTLLQTKPKENINDFLATILPEMLKNQMNLEQVKRQAAIWLNNQLQEYQAYGDIQAKQSKEAFIRETLGKLITPDFYKDRPMPEVTMAHAIQGLFPADVVSQLGINVPAKEEQTYADSILAGRDALNARQTLDNIPPDQLATLVRTIGYKPILETVQEIQKEKQARDEMALRGKELTETQKATEVRKEEVGIRKEEVGMETTGKEKKSQLRAKLEKREGEVNDYVDRYLGITGGMYRRFEPEEQEKIIGQIERVMADVKDVRKSLGIKPPQDLDTIVARLKAAGHTKESLLDNLKLRNDFINLGIDPLIFMEYLDSAGPKKK